VHEDSVMTPGGKPTRYGWVETAPAVNVVAIDDHGKVTLVKQLRYTTGRPQWELPGGNMDGEDPLAAGRRELEAQARLHADKWVSLSGDYFVWSGVATQRNNVLIARELHKAKTPTVQTDEMVEAVQTFSWAELKEMMKNGELNDGQSITALTLAGLHLEYFK
jgi:8-oxo-dGTP pyrophosphatase MutT (NUDIX family)